MELFQLYDTDPWGSHASRTNLGVFSSVRDALYSLVKNPQTEEADTERLIAIFTEENRLFVEKITVDEVEGYEQVYDSENDEDMDELKRIVFFESVERFRDGLGFLSVSEDEIPFDTNAIQSVEDVSDDLIEEYLSDEKEIVRFIMQSF